MSKFKAIRERLNATQQELAQVVGRTQGNISFYEKGQAVPIDVAKCLIAFGKTKGVKLSYEDFYGPAVPRQPAKAKAV